MITDWEQVYDLLDLLDSKEARSRLHPKIKQRTVSVWIFYSKTASMFSATVRRRDILEGRRGSTLYTAPCATLGQAVFAALSIVAKEYEHTS